MTDKPQNPAFDVSKFDDTELIMAGLVVLMSMFTMQNQAVMGELSKRASRGLTEVKE